MHAPGVVWLLQNGPPTPCGLHAQVDYIPHTVAGLLAAGLAWRAWLLVAVDHCCRCNGGAPWGSPSVASPSQCSLEETFSVDASHFPKFRIPSQPTPDHCVPDHYTLVTPPTNPHLPQAAARQFFPPARTRPQGIPQTPIIPWPDQALYLDSPPSSASRCIPSATLDTDQHIFCPTTCSPRYTSTTESSSVISGLLEQKDHRPNCISLSSCRPNARQSEFPFGHLCQRIRPCKHTTNKGSTPGATRPQPISAT